MSGIAGASLTGVNWNRIRQHGMSLAVEVERLGRVMQDGTGSEEEFHRLCKVLIDVGECEKAKELLLGGAAFGSEGHHIFSANFGGLEKKFADCLETFSRQFGVRLRCRKYNGILSQSCDAECLTGYEGESVERKVRHLLAHGGILSVVCESDEAITADVFQTDGTDAVPLVFDGCAWVVDPSIPSKSVEDQRPAPPPDQQ